MEEKYLDITEMINSIQQGLEANEVPLSADVIEMVLDLEMKYMIDNGFTEYVEEGE